MLFKYFLQRTPRRVFQRWQSQVARIDKLLIANRGEIACRVIRTARKMGVKTVSVYSDIDRDSMHVAMADEAYNIGPSQASESYLRGDKLIQVAFDSGCQAIHPGYGFLSENAEFAELCKTKGIIFVGPPASAIRDMGIKSTAKEIMTKAGVPVIGGYHGADQSDERLKLEANRIGYPLMVKAVRGGGGKGMRVAMTPAELGEALDSARREATKAFGDSDLLLEHFVEEPRHVEVQVFADQHKNAVYLFERDCSVQRRHQKIIEEAPAPGISWDLRKELGEAAVKAALAVGYEGAGTVEFILDRKTLKFHFMEMNTRLQVEHPITEMITGTDLVAWQLQVAAGEKLPLKQEDIHLRGHSFEARIYAEDPQAGFLPGSGPLLYLSTPSSSEHVRVETGVRQGDEVSVHYDPMIAKLVVWGNNREEALAKLERNLVDYKIAGVETNINFLLTLARHPKFKAGDVHTNFIRDEHSSLFTAVEDKGNLTSIQAAAATVALDEFSDFQDAFKRNDHYNPFVTNSGFRLNHQRIRTFNMKANGKDIIAKVKYICNNTYHVSINDDKWVTVKAELQKEDGDLCLSIDCGGKLSNCKVFTDENKLYIFNEMGQTVFEHDQPSFIFDDDSGQKQISDENAAVSPMPGILDRLLVSVGAAVKAGDPLCVVVAMKMEHLIKASRDCRIGRINRQPGDRVKKNEVLIEFE